MLDLTQFDYIRRQLDEIVFRLYADGASNTVEENSGVISLYNGRKTVIVE